THIEDDQMRAVFTGKCHAFCPRLSPCDGVTFAFEAVCQAACHRRVIFNNQNMGCFHTAAAIVVVIGSRMVNRVAPGLLKTSICPRWTSTIARIIASPSPLPGT